MLVINVQLCWTVSVMFLSFVLWLLLYRREAFVFRL